MSKAKNWLYSKSVEIRVRVEVEFPMEAVEAGIVEMTDETAKELALSAIVQKQEVDCGRHGQIQWATIYAEASEEDCEVWE